MTDCIVLRKVYQQSGKIMATKSYLALQRAKGKMLRELFSGVPISTLVHKYGFSEQKIRQMADAYKQGKIDIFDDINQRKIALSLMTHQEETQMLHDKIKALENALKLAKIKAEGYEIMMGILNEEYGIDLSKKVEAEQSRNSKKSTRK